MKKPPSFPALIACLFVAALASSQGWGPTPQEEAKVISVLGLAPGKVVGEIGAGDGHLSLVAARAVAPGGRVFATELGEAKREALKRNADTAGVKNLEIVEARIKTTGLAASCCDAVFMRDVYHHLTAPVEILADLRKVLRPQGLLLIVDFEPRGSLPPVDGVPDDRRGHGIPVGVVVGELKAAGFEIVTEDPDWRNDLYAVVARNPSAAK
jgi:ubiquinone/menaquinone biosynthesis C-methylase UbiE